MKKRGQMDGGRKLGYLKRTEGAGMDQIDPEREIDEAIRAGNETLRYLQEAKDALRSASHFGIADFLGFDMIGGIGKHMKAQSAQRSIEKARAQVSRFQKELRDVDSSLTRDIDIGGFLSFADFFFDGFIADWLVQSKINQARRQVDDGIKRVEDIIDALRKRRVMLM